MNILLTNDDGYRAGGINFLNDYFKKRGHKVFMVAPHTQRSAVSHAITLNDSIRLEMQFDNVWVTTGTPADCTMLALLGMIEEKIELVVSGINHGPNIGKDIIYSGTVAAARQASLNGIPSMALSANTWEDDIYFENVERFLDDHFERLAAKCDSSFVMNINFPNIPPEEIKGIKKTIPCRHNYYNDELVSFDSPFQGKYFWISGNGREFKDDPRTDYHAVENGYISVSPIKILPEEAELDLEF